MQGNAHAEFDRLMIPAFSSFLNFASAIFSLSVANRRGRVNMGRWLPVSMWCSTPCVGEGVSVSDLTMEGYFVRIHLTGSGMALLTSCSGVLAASESAAVLLQETFLTSPIGAAGAVSAVEADQRGGVVFTDGAGVAAAPTYSDVSGLWSLSNTCACRGWMDS